MSDQWVKQYQKKPVPVDAVKVSYSDKSLIEYLKEWAGTNIEVLETGVANPKCIGIDVLTNHGKVRCEDGAWLVHGGSDFYPISHEEFTRFYEEVQ